MILPSDFINDNRSNDPYPEGQGILDFVLGQHLGDLANHKGNNIVRNYDKVLLSV
jgi:hypothetical protein